MASSRVVKLIVISATSSRHMALTWLGLGHFCFLGADGLSAMVRDADGDLIRLDGQDSECSILLSLS